MRDVPKPDFIYFHFELKHLYKISSTENYTSESIAKYHFLFDGSEMRQKVLMLTNNICQFMQY